MQRQMGWRVLAAYLAVTAPAALGPAAPLAVAIGHMGFLAIAAGLGWARREHAAQDRPRWLDWGPLVAMTILYAELPGLMAGAASLRGGVVVYHDLAIQRWEFGLFGTSPAESLAARLPSALAGLLHTAYLAYYGLIFIPPLVLFSRKSGPAFRSTILGLTLSFAACFVVFVYLPVEGPRYVWSTPPGMPHTMVRDLTLRVLRAGSSRGAAFPSSHVAVATTQAVMALKHQRRVGLATAVCAALLAVGAVYGGFHYGVDVLAGAGLGGIVAAAVLLYGRASRKVLSMSDVSTPALNRGLDATR